MYHGKKISVAIATYNGEKTLIEQIDSILSQTVLPDEIIFSDDGSTDHTLDILYTYRDKAASLSTAIIVLSDNPRHGIGGNFEWAINHCTGNLIFICGQDDVWLPEKVEHVANGFIAHSDAKLICHNLCLIDKFGQPINNMNVYSNINTSSLAEGDLILLPREDYIDTAVSSVLISGPAVCISKSCVQDCMPIPTKSAEDHWLQFCAVSDNCMYYLNEMLTKYRMHDSDSHSLGISLSARISKILLRIRNACVNKKDLIQYANAVIQRLNPICNQNGVGIALKTAHHILEIGTKEVDAASSNCIIGAIKLGKLYLSDIRFRRMGFKQFIISLLNILFVSKKKRITDIYS